MAGVFDEMMGTVNQLTQFVINGAYLKLRRNLFSSVRWTLVGGATNPLPGSYYLFDRPTMVNNAWGSGAAGAVLDDIDMPEWFNLNNRVMPENKYYIAEFMSIDWVRRAVANTLNATFATDKTAIVNSNAYVEIKPRDKDINWREPLRRFADYMVEQPRDILAAGPQTVSDNSHVGNDSFGGKIPMFPDEQTPGILFDSKSTINIKLNIITAPIVITNELKSIFNFDGWFFREL